MVKLMIIKIVFYVLAYLFLGTITLTIMLWHDRNVRWIDRWIDNDEVFSSLTVLFFPLVWVTGIFWFLFLIFPVKFAHFIMAIPTTIVYVIKALKEDKHGKDNN